MMHYYREADEQLVRMTLHNLYRECKGFGTRSRRYIFNNFEKYTFQNFAKCLLRWTFQTEWLSHRTCLRANHRLQQLL